MQHVDEHMDDLFRNAAEHYQLKEGNNWDKIAPYLTSSATPTAAAVVPKNNNRPWLILVALLLLSPLMLITFNKEKPTPQLQSTGKNTSAQQTIVHTSARSIQPQTTSGLVQLASNQSPKAQTKDPVKNIPPVIRPVAATNTTEANQPITEIPASNLPVQSVDPTHKRDFETYAKISTAASPLTNTDPYVAASIPVKKTPEPRGLYLGLLAGPQWNQVEGQGYNKAGLNLGLIAGFRFNKKLAVESGISYSKKYYYSDGAHFHMKKNTGTPIMKVISLEGNSNVIEIPAKIKYDIINKKKGSLFVTSGLSTYILTKENNQYYALINGTPQNSNVIYDNRKTYVAGGMNLSAGYSIHLKKKTDFRIEPYLQIPFKGTGVGSMRVTTAGLNIGITRNLHQ
jgi:hypothetical protein